MSKYNQNFIFYEYSTLINEDAVLYQFKYSEDCPITLSGDGKDLQLHIDWSRTDVEEIFRYLDEIKVLDFNQNETIDTLAHMFFGEDILFNKDLSLYCRINLKALPNCVEIKYTDLLVTRYRVPLSNFYHFLPEFLLDLGESLEDNQTAFCIENMGVLGEPFSNLIDPKARLEDLAQAYIALEHLKYVLDEFNNADLKKSFEKTIKKVVADFREGIVESYDIEEGELLGVESFERMLKSYRKDLPKNINPKIKSSYSSHEFLNFPVLKAFTVKLKLKIPLTQKIRDYFTSEMLKYYHADLYIVDAGAHKAENIWWVHNTQFMAVLEQEDPRSYALIYKISPTFSI